LLYLAPCAEIPLIDSLSRWQTLEQLIVRWQYSTERLYGCKVRAEISAKSHLEIVWLMLA